MAKVLIQHEQRENVDGKSRIIADERLFFVADLSRDFMTPNGSIPKAEFAKPDGSVVKTNTGKELVMFTATFADAFKRIKKLPQTVMPKDIGMIISFTGVGSDSVVIDAGAGSGALAAGLARVCKQVTTYEMRDDFIENLKANFKMLGLSNVTLKHADIGKGVSEKDVDLVTLDMPEPVTVLDAIIPALKIGGFVVCYVPTVPQMMDCVDGLSKRGLFVVRSMELILRDWIVEGKKVRPDNEMLGHTAFLIFARKIQ
jgi:tRNA (adenine57-N1/adenine58-N1)-methyltransferase